MPDAEAPHVMMAFALLARGVGHPRFRLNLLKKVWGAADGRT